jgi:predicted TIM-barrel fold metal-dependent hydrolase
MIVDCHTHIFESGRGGPLDLPASADDLLSEMDHNGVHRAIVLPLPGVAGNSFVFDQCTKHPDRLTALYLPEFDSPGSVVARMEAFLKNHPVHGLKIHPRRQNVSIGDPEVKDVLRWAAARDLPVLFDSFSWGASLGRTDLEPAAYHALAQEMPNLRMLLAHAGGHKILDAFLAAKSNANIYLDISLTPVYFRGSSIEKDVAFICSRLPAGRVLYGSDFPFTYFRQHLDVVRELTSGCSESVKRALFGEAACGLFRIS